MARKLNKHNGKRCAYCPRIMVDGHEQLRPTRDHIVPQAFGGRETVIACAQCNTTKANMMPNMWVAYMIANPEWWLLKTRSERHAARVKAVAMFNEMMAKSIPFRMPHGWLRRARTSRFSGTQVVVPPELVFPPTAAAQAEEQVRGRPSRAQRPKATPPVEAEPQANGGAPIIGRKPRAYRRVRTFHDLTIMSVPRSPQEILADALRAIPDERHRDALKAVYSGREHLLRDDTQT